MLLSNRVIQQITESSNTPNQWQKDKLDEWYWANVNNRNPRIQTLREKVKVRGQK